MTDGNKSTSSDQRALIKFLLENRAMVNWISILMIVYAVWATIEVLTNASGATWWPPETGIPASELFNSDNSTQNINNGWVIGLGAIFGTVGTMIQYFYRAAPYVDASMQATAALIISAVKEEEIQESAEKLAIEMVAEAEEEAAAEEAAEAAEAAAEAAEAAAEETETQEGTEETAIEAVDTPSSTEEDEQRKKF
ncbi:hypothetical protein N9O16_04710 [Candidatus Poseidoniaceae archaeon]|nr:hypothetical protein [Euryarchaeota archaeon]MDA8843639.1 hypothetical protein [Euryarchaeota archaeon]MDA9166775.1 hypothetical protein [Candidatus Poseidoniaceae archaeon]MDC3235801.1 hypothetical protein [Candidatus Poseidoniaceae archaeon]